ncbi:PTS sugar transporter [Coriobacteriales bacterium OH1046]|nr:PTS sugar transporter [Coriobacteriales bacterium OH1046]
MLRFVLASHGHLAEGMKDTLQVILGQLDNVDTLCAYVDPDITIRTKIKALFAMYAPEDTVVVVTDIFGGSVNNEFMVALSDYEFFLVCGMNMPLLVQLLSSDELAAQDIDEAIGECREAILLCNDLAASAGEAEDF